MIECKCTLVQFLVGDGCRVCQPDAYIDMIETHLKEADKRIEELEEQVRRKDEVMRKAIVHAKRAGGNFRGYGEDFDFGFMELRDLTESLSVAIRHTNTPKAETCPECGACSGLGYDWARSGDGETKVACEECHSTGHKPESIPAKLACEDTWFDKEGADDE